MISIISPSLTMEECNDNYTELTIPKQIDLTKKIVDKIKTFSENEMKEIMKLNNKLYILSKKRYDKFKFDLNGSAAISLYSGTVYKNIQPSIFNKDEIEFCRKHIRILSGLYGVLNPYDSIYEHRIEMKLPIKIEGKDLYGFFGKSLYDLLVSEDREIVNLCSAEYGKAIIPYITNEDKFITCSFKIYNDGKYKTMSVDAKAARGKMVNFIVKHKINNLKDLIEFNENGYTYKKEMSSEKEYVFVK